MTLIGSGVLVNWGGVLGGTEADYVAWHSDEHMPERLAVPGFRRGRRAAAVPGTPVERQYFMMYEADAPETFISAPYLERLNDPTPWTRRVLATYVAPSRTVCRVLSTGGVGVGGWIGTIVAAPNDAEIARRLLSHPVAAIGPAGSVRPPWAGALEGLPGLIGIHALAGEDSLGQQPTAEKSFRESGGQPDRTVDIAILVEAVDHETCETAIDRLLADAALARALGDMVPTVYVTQHVLTKADL